MQAMPAVKGGLEQHKRDDVDFNRILGVIQRVVTMVWL